MIKSRMQRDVYKRQDLIGLAADKPADGALGAADAGRQLCLGNFMLLHKLLHPLPDIAGQVGSLHMTHLFSANSL